MTGKFSSYTAKSPVVGTDQILITDNDSTAVSKSVVLSAIKTYTSLSPTLVTPALGTPSAGVISACTSTSMVMVTPVLGTPTSGALSNCTLIPVNQGTGVLPDASMPNLTGDVTTVEGAVATTIGANKVLLSMVAPAAKTEAIGIACGDETTVLSVADGVTEFQLPYGFELTSVRATLTTAGTTSGVTTIDIEDDGTSIFATLLTIDATEKTSTSAATAFDFTASASSLTLGDGSVMKINVDVLSGGATEAGLKIWLIGYQT